MIKTQINKWTRSVHMGRTSLIGCVQGVSPFCWVWATWRSLYCLCTAGQRTRPPSDPPSSPPEMTQMCHCCFYQFTGYDEKFKAHYSVLNMVVYMVVTQMYIKWWGHSVSSYLWLIDVAIKNAHTSKQISNRRSHYRGKTALELQVNSLMMLNKLRSEFSLLSFPVFHLWVVPLHFLIGLPFILSQTRSHSLSFTNRSSIYREREWGSPRGDADASPGPNVIYTVNKTTPTDHIINSHTQKDMLT